MSFKVHIVSADRTIEVPTGATILETALEAGIAYPHGCRSGTCGTCKSHLVKGDVALDGYSEFALSDEEKARGLLMRHASPTDGRTHALALTPAGEKALARFARLVKAHEKRIASSLSAVETRLLIELLEKVRGAAGSL